MIHIFNNSSACNGYRRLQKLAPNFSRITIGIVSILLIVNIDSGYRSGLAKTTRLKINQATLAEVERW